jgi:hypothetical protein
VIRTLVPGLAGTARIPYRTFAIYNVAGGLLWAAGAALLGYAAGSAYQAAERIARQAGLAVLGVVAAGATAALVYRRRRRHHGPPPSRSADQSGDEADRASHDHDAEQVGQKRVGQDGPPDPGIT